MFLVSSYEGKKKARAGQGGKQAKRTKEAQEQSSNTWRDKSRYEDSRNVLTCIVIV
jgi:hypothetical protein